MTNLNYEQAKETLENKLKETRNEIRRLQTKLNKLYAENPEVIKCKEKIKNSMSEIEKRKANFVQFCQGYFSKMFFNKEFLKTPEYDAIKGFPFIDDLEFVWREAVDMEICWGFENVTEEFINNFDYDKCIKILNNERLKDALNLRSETSPIHNVIKDIIDTIKECEEDNLDLTKDLQKAKRKRNFFAKFGNLEKRNKKVKWHEDQYKYNKDMLNGFMALKPMLENMGYSFEELLENYKKNSDYKMVKNDISVVESYEKHLKNLRERIAYNSGIEEQINNLRSKETKMSLLKESFNSEVIKNIAKDPAFLINLGKESITSPKNSLNGKINKHLVEKYVSEGIEQ